MWERLPLAPPLPAVHPAPAQYPDSLQLLPNLLIPHPHPPCPHMLIPLLIPNWRPTHLRHHLSNPAHLLALPSQHPSAFWGVTLLPQPRLPPVRWPQVCLSLRRPLQRLKSPVQSVPNSLRHAYVLIAVIGQLTRNGSWYQHTCTAAQFPGCWSSYCDSFQTLTECITDLLFVDVDCVWWCFQCSGKGPTQLGPMFSQSSWSASLESRAHPGPFKVAGGWGWRLQGIDREVDIGGQWAEVKYMYARILFQGQGQIWLHYVWYWFCLTIDHPIRVLGLRNHLMYIWV